MADNQREFAARRERLALRSHVAAQATSLVEVDIGNFVGVHDERTLWISATPVAESESRISALGAVLAWRARAQLGPQEASITNIKLLDSTTPEITARRAAYFSLPIDVLDVRGGAAVVARRAEHPAVVQPSADHLMQVGMFTDAGAEVVVEHGVVTAEVAGLQVARVVDEDGQAITRIGVGMHDQEMFKMLHGGIATADQLRGVVRTVREHRRSGAASHPLNLLAPERALRARFVAEPDRIGLRVLTLAEPPIPRSNVKDTVPCCAIGVDERGGSVVAVFVAGVDLDAVPFAADARGRLAPEARLLIVAEPRNIVPLQKRIAALLTQPAEFISA
ncbi:MAG: hypothetical protein RLZZ518_668 [Actinomycetota bacterium]